MTPQPVFFHPRLGSAATPQSEIDDDQDDLMAGSDFELEQQAIHRSSASASLTSATPKQHAMQASGGSSSSTSPSASQNGPSSANAPHNSISPRRISHRAEAPSESSLTRLPSAGPSRHTSRSPSELLSAGSGDEDEDEYLPGDSEDEAESADAVQQGTAGIQRNAQTPSASTSRICQNLYSSDEDGILRDAVRQHGNRWQEVGKTFNERSTGVTRSASSLKGRWEALLRGGRARPRLKAQQPWTQAETSVLRTSLRAHEQPDGSHLWTKIREDFRQAFPESTRSSSSIRSKCKDLLDKRSGRRGSIVGHLRPKPSSLGATSSSTALTTPLLATPSSTLASAQEHESVSVAASATESPINCDNAAPSMALRGEGSPILPSGLTSTQGNVSSSRGQTHSQRQPQPRKQTERHPQRRASQSPSQPLDVNVLYQQNSICIENCPRDAHVAIYTETLVKITREAPQPTVIAFGTSYEAAFHFHVMGTGSIRAERLPANTTTSVTPVPASESCDGGTYIDTVFTGADNYVVLFRSRL